MPVDRLRCAFAILLAASAASLSSCRGRPATPPAPPQPNVVLITVDTLRADRLGRGLTPNIDRLAARWLSFTQARAAVPLTLPSHASILSGLLPPRHGVRLNGVGHFRDHPTLATILKQRGYRTAAAVGAFVLNRQFGLDAGFDFYDDNVRRDPATSTALEAERPASAVTDAALGAVKEAGPWFLWVHYYDPHAPYDPPARFLRPAAPGVLPSAQGHVAAVSGPADRYDGEVAYVDAEIGRLLDGLRTRPGFESREVLVVIAGDHGESLGEHGEATHGMLLYDGALRVPLLFASLGGKDRLRPGVRSESVSLVDIAPTILAFLAIKSPEAMDGTDLLAPPKPAREVYAETEYPRVAGWTPLTALVSPPWKLIRGGRPQLFDLAQDAAETRSLAAERAAIAVAMDSTLRGMTAGAKEATAPLGSEARERLRSLGYVASAPAPPAGGAEPDPADRTGEWRDFETASADLAGGRGAAALARLKALAARNPGAQVFHTTLARALAESGRAAEALLAYRAAVSRWPGDATLLHDLAVAARDASQPDEALRAEQAALTVDPAYAAAFNGLGLLHADAGRGSEAVQAFERAVALDRSDPSYWANLGNARRALGNLDTARQAYDAALALDATWPDAANGMGVLEVQGGRPAAAIPWFEKALARDPGLVEARLNLGIACQESGLAARARANYEAVLKSPPRFARERDAARTLLRKLGR